MNKTIDTDFGPYHVQERLGIGGMASVHKAIETCETGERRVVALKRLLPHLAEDQSFVRAFAREAKLASLLKHENIVGIHQFGRVGSDYFISMELIEGRDLRKILRQSKRVVGPPPINVTVAILLQICEALDYAHSRRDESGQLLGIVHRDISPSNLVATQNGVIKLIDFGIARAQTEALRTNTGRIKGKLAYMAPEASQGRELDGRSDLFSVGVISHELLTATPLFAAKNDYETLMRVQRADVLPPSALNPKCPPELDGLILKALAKQRDNRWNSARAMHSALTEIRRTYQLAATKTEISNWLRWAFAFEDPPISSQLTPSGMERPQGKSPVSVPSQVPVVPPGRPSPAEKTGVWKPIPGAVDLLKDVPDVSEKMVVAGRRQPDQTPQGKRRPPTVGESTRELRAPKRWPRSTAAPQEPMRSDKHAPTEKIDLRKRKKQTRSAVLPLISAAVILGGLAVAFLLWRSKQTTSQAPVASAKVQFNGLPDSAVIHIDGKKIEDMNLQLEPGTYPVKIEAEGFKTWHDDIEVAAGDVQKIFPPLTKSKPTAPQISTVRISRPKRMKILVDGEDIGLETPTQFFVTAGERTIALADRKDRIVWNNIWQAEHGKKYEFRPKLRKKRRKKRSSDDTEVIVSDVTDDTPKGLPVFGSISSMADVSGKLPNIGKKLKKPRTSSSSKGAELIAPNQVKATSKRRIIVANHNMHGQWVSARTCINTSGNVTSVRVVTKVSNSVAVQVERGLKGWKFTPYTDADGTKQPACFNKNILMD